LIVVAEAENGLAAVQLVEEHQPDVVVMDLSMPVMNGIEATKIITSRFPDTRVIVLSVHSENTITAMSCQAGACYHLSKDSSLSEIFTAVRDGHQNRCDPCWF
jgi:two-component system response regulator DegU